eukprot:10275875-Alexandrium_andersonii.AAC.1
MEAAVGLKRVGIPSAADKAIIEKWQSMRPADQPVICALLDLASAANASGGGAVGADPPAAPAAAEGPVAQTVAPAS